MAAVRMGVGSYWPYIVRALLATLFMHMVATAQDLNISTTSNCSWAVLDGQGVDQLSGPCPAAQAVLCQYNPSLCTNSQISWEVGYLIYLPDSCCATLPGRLTPNGTVISLAQQNQDTCSYYVPVGESALHVVVACPGLSFNDICDLNPSLCSTGQLVWQGYQRATLRDWCCDGISPGRLLDTGIVVNISAEPQIGAPQQVINCNQTQGVCSFYSFVCFADHPCAGWINTQTSSNASYCGPCNGSVPTPCSSSEPSNNPSWQSVLAHEACTLAPDLGCDIISSVCTEGYLGCDLICSDLAKQVTETVASTECPAEVSPLDQCQCQLYGKNSSSCSGIGCFPGGSYVQTMMGQVPIEALAQDDLVLTVDGWGHLQFESVIFHSHADATLNISVVIINAGASTLSIAPNHFLWATAARREAWPTDIQFARDATITLAGSLVPGDLVWLVDDPVRQPRATLVTKINTAYAAGAYSPQTVSGTLIVDGFVALTYTNATWLNKATHSFRTVVASSLGTILPKSAASSINALVLRGAMHVHRFASFVVAAFMH